MALEFTPAKRYGCKLRMLIGGISGSGKSYTGLTICKALTKKPRFAAIDTEFMSLSKYADFFDFDVLVLEPPFEPEKYIAALKAAEAAGYDVVFIDSLSHEWVGSGGCLQIQQKITDASDSKNSYVAWNKVTPRHDALPEAILQSKCHVVCTSRSKAEYAESIDDKGRKTIKKIGTQLIQRNEIEYEFDLVAEMDGNHNIKITKTRFPMLEDMAGKKPDVDFFKPLVDALTGENDPMATPESRIEYAKSLLEKSDWDSERKEKALARIADAPTVTNVLALKGAIKNG